MRMAYDPGPKSQLQRVESDGRGRRRAKRVVTRLALVTGLVALASSLLVATPAFAATSVTPGSATLASNIAGSNTTYTIGFMTSSSGALVAGDTITFVAPDGTAFSSNTADYLIAVNHSDAAIVSNVAVSEVTGSGGGGISATPNQVVLTLGTSSIADGDMVTVTADNTSNPTTASNAYVIDESTSADTAAAASPTYIVTAGPAATVTKTPADDDQTAVTGQAFQNPLTVMVTDFYGNAVSGATVTFAAPASGASATFASCAGGNPEPYECSVTTNSSGAATSSTVTANGTSGMYSVSATVSSTGANADFSLTNEAAPLPTVTAGSVILSSATAGTSGVTYTVHFETSATGALTFGNMITLVAPNGTTFPSSPSTDYSVTATSGTALVTSVTVSDVQGPGDSGASATPNKVEITLGVSTIGNSDNVTVTVSSMTNPTLASTSASASYVLDESTSADSGVAASQAYSVTPGPPTKVVAVSGKTQTVPVGTSFAPFGATVEDQFGNQEGSGTLVTFTAPASGATGTFTNGTRVNTQSTGTNGEAISEVFTANDTAGGPYMVAASDSSTTGVTPADFDLTNSAGPATTVAIVSGSGQSTTVDTAFTNPLDAVVTDTFGNPVPGATVTFGAPSSGPSGTFGACAGGNPQMYECLITTNASGDATSSAFTANTAAGSYDISATSGTGAVNFSETNTVGSATTMAIVAGNSQNAPVGSAYGTALEVNVVDAHGNAVPGVSVTFTAPSGASGSFATCAGGNPQQYECVVMTDASGNATASVFTANDTAGPVTVTASATGVTSRDFALTNEPGSAATMAIVAGNSQNATVGSAYGTALEVNVVDAHGNAVPGVSVTFTAPSSGASGSFATCAGGNPQASECAVMTDASGNATASVFTANGTGGAYEVLARSEGIPSQAFHLTNKVVPGYWMVGRDGGVFGFGNAGFVGSLPGLGVHVNNIVGIVGTHDGGGYWMVGSDGGVFGFGDAGFVGSLPGLGVHVNNIVGIVPTSDGGGYWMVGRDGGVFGFGDAGFVGSLPGLGVHVNNIVGIVPTPDGGGYWMVGSDGGVFGFGDAGFVGSLPGLGVHVSNIVGIVPTPDGGGYWMVGADGGVFGFGDAGFVGSLPGLGVHVDDIVGIVPT
jgi:hypothetical protein